jgi:hypothetical protein
MAILIFEGPTALMSPVTAPQSLITSAAAMTVLLVEDSSILAERLNESICSA